MTSTARRLENCVTDVGQWMSANRLKLNTEKTELLDQDTYGQSSVTDCRPSFQLGADTVTAQDDVRLLGSSDNLVGPESVASCVQRVRNILLLHGCVSSDAFDYTATLVHAFVTSRVDQCNAVGLLAGAMKSVTDTLQRVMNAAARVVSDTRKFVHGLTQILHDDLHMARCGRSSDVQTRCHHAQMSAWQGSAVPRGLLHTGH